MLSRSLDITNILYCTVPRGCRHAAAQAGWLTQGQSLQFSLNLQYTLKLKLLVEVVAQRFFGTDLRPWWTQHFENATLALAAAEEQTELRRSRAQDPAVSSCSSPPRLLPLPLLLLLLLLLLLRTPTYSYVLLRTPTYSYVLHVLLRTPTTTTTTPTATATAAGTPAEPEVMAVEPCRRTSTRSSWLSCRAGGVRSTLSWDRWYTARPGVLAQPLFGTLRTARVLRCTDR